MVFSNEQMTILREYEKYFDTALHGGWARYPGDAGMRQIFQIYKDATGDNRNLRTSCGSCVLSLLRDVGAVYFKDKELVETQTRVQEPVKKVAVKTRKKKE